MERIKVELVPYSEADFWLLERNNAPEMMIHLGGPESVEQLSRRHQRYLALPQTGNDSMFKAVLLPEAVGVGLFGYWEKTWRDHLVWEAGWAVLPEYQGRGIAKAALIALILKAQQRKLHRYMHAYPAMDNGPSNGICRSVGFKWMEVCEFEYPPGHFMQCNDWQLDLEAYPSP